MITWKGSPNFTTGRGGKKIDFIVIHWIVGRLSAADAVFAKAGGTSAHYGVGPTAIHQYVKEENTAYHAGVWDVNQRSIGIEHEGGPTLPITDAVYQNSAKLIREIRSRHGNLPLRKHNEFKATQCPGTLDLARLDALARQGDTNPMELTRQQKIDGYRALAGREPSEAELNLKRTSPEFYIGFKVEIDARIAQSLQAGKNSRQGEIDGLNTLVTTLKKDLATLTAERDKLVKNEAILNASLIKCQSDLETCNNKPPVIKEVIVEKEVHVPTEDVGLGRLFELLISRIFTRKD